MAGFNGFIPQLLAALKAPNTPQNRLFLQAWQRAEGGSASFNPFNTTQPESGASDYNSVHVKNYGSAGQGLQATVETLLNGRYNNIVGDLRSGHATAQQLGTDVANSPWGTGSGVLRVLGSGPAPTPRTGAGKAAGMVVNKVLAPPSPQLNQLLASYLLSSGSGGMSGDGLIQLALARKALGAAVGPVSDGKPTGGKAGQGMPKPPQGGESLAGNFGRGGKVSFIGSTDGLDSHFVGALSSAAASQGATQIRVISGYRSPQHNAAVGGVSHSLHIRGAAMDGEGFVPGKGWIPLGQLLAPVAGKFGLRSGDQPGFFHGGPDPNHVDFLPSLGA